MYSLNAQTHQVSGFVKNEDGEALIGATIVLEGTSLGTITDEMGSFSLEVQKGSYRLICKHLGYESKEVEINHNNPISIILEQSTGELEEVVVIGFGEQIKRNLTSSLAKLDETAFKNVSVSNFQRAIQGRMPGVVMTNSSGGLNSEAIIRIRGTGSVNAGNQPLIVIDGLIMAARPGGTLGYSTNPFLGLNPNDIESIEVLKDAAAASIYGSRGANGVILISTKSGGFNQRPRVNLDFYAGFSEISKKRELLNGREYASLWNEAAKNVGETSSIYPNPETEPHTDWQNLLLRKGFVQESSASITGGTAMTNYYFGGSFRKENHYLHTIGLSRFSMRANIEQKIGDKVTAGISINPSRVVDNRTGNQWAGSAWAAASWYSPNLEALDENGNCHRDPLTTSNGAEGGFAGNPCTVLEDQWIEAARTSALLNAHLSWTPLPGLRFRTEWGSEFSHENQHLKFGSATWFGSPEGWALEYHQQVLNYNWASLATWTQSFKKGHHFDATLGFHLSKEKHDRISVDGSGFANDRLRYLGAASLIEYVGTEQSEAAFLGFLTRLNYNVQNKYLLSLSARYDGSSRFGAENRYGFFPALSAGWIFSEEDFFSSQHIDFLKLRASIGLTGNANITDFAAKGLVDFSPEYSGQPGFVIQSIQNELLGWEKNLQWNGGLEFSLWDHRITGTAEYYLRHTKDLLLEKPVPATNGISILTSNVGEISNQGFEFELSVDVLRGNFGWRMELNGASLKNKVLRLVDKDGDGMEDDILLYSRMLLRPGEAIGSFFLVEYAGVDPDNGDALFYDLNGNRVANGVSASNRKIVGKSIPSFTGGFSHNFTYKNFDLSAFFHFKLGHKIYMRDRNLEENMTWGGNQHRSQLNYWTPDNQNTDVPQPRLFQLNGSQQSTRYLEDGSFLRLQHLTLGYTFQNLGSQDATFRLFAAVQNLVTFTGFRGLDPDNEFRSVEGAAIGTIHYNQPAARTYSLGFNLEF